MTNEKRTAFLAWIFFGVIAMQTSYLRNSNRMRKETTSPTSETRWTRGAWLTLAAAILFVTLNAAQIAYRLTIPSLGWAGPDPESVSVAAPYFELDFNAVGAPSDLASGDIVKTIGGIDAEQILAKFPVSVFRPPNWEIGEKVELEIVRDGQTLSIEVPIVLWTVLAWFRANFSRFSEAINWLVVLLLFGVGTFTFFQRPGNLAARFLFAFGLASFSMALGDSIPDYIALYFDVPAAFATAFFSNIIFAYLLGPSFLGFALTFPKPKLVIQRQPRWLLLPYLIGSVTIILLFIDPELATIGFLLTFGMLLLGVIALIHSGLTMRDAISRAQLRLAIGGVVTGAGVFMLNFASNTPPPYREIILFVANFGLPIISFSLAIAILRYRLFDIDVIIRKTLQYTLLTGLLALVYFGSVLMLQTLVENLTGEQSQLVIVLSTLAIAALFNPIRSASQDFIDRRFYRKKYNAEKALARFAATARDEVDMDKLTTALLVVVGETMQPEKTSLWLKK